GRTRSTAWSPPATSTASWWVCAVTCSASPTAWRRRGAAPTSGSRPTNRCTSITRTGCAAWSGGGGAPVPRCPVWCCWLRTLPCRPSSPREASHAPTRETRVAIRPRVAAPQPRRSRGPEAGSGGPLRRVQPEPRGEGSQRLHRLLEEHPQVPHRAGAGLGGHRLLRRRRDGDPHRRGLEDLPGGPPRRRRADPGPRDGAGGVAAGPGRLRLPRTAADHDPHGGALPLLADHAAAPLARGALLPAHGEEAHQEH